MHTRKLYWADPYRQSFTASILQRRTSPQPALILNRTLFYPTGGGQPHDTGRLGDARVLDVYSEDGAIIHVVDHLPATSTEISGSIDWPRRWDHMQQHSGQHVLSAVCESLLQRPTIGFHLSEQSLTIDLPGAPPASDEIDAVQERCQAIIEADLPLISHIMDPRQAAGLELRKSPDVQGAWRVVEIPGIDRCACGGTHVRSTAAIGSIVILKVERRGNDTRLHFACGRRAWRDHLRRLNITRDLSAQLTTGLEELPAAVSKLQQDLQQSQRQGRRFQEQLRHYLAAELWASAPQVAGIRLIRHTLQDDNPKSLGRLAGELVAQGPCLVLLAWDNPRPRWLISRSPDVDFDLSALLPHIRQFAGVRGGGNAHTLQGGAADLPTLQNMLQQLQQLVQRQLAAQGDEKSQAEQGSS